MWKHTTQCILWQFIKMFSFICVEFLSLHCSCNIWSCICCWWIITFFNRARNLLFFTINWENGAYRRGLPSTCARCFQQNDGRNRQRYYKTETGIILQLIYSFDINSLYMIPVSSLSSNFLDIFISCTKHHVVERTVTLNIIRTTLYFQFKNQTTIWMLKDVLIIVGTVILKVHSTKDNMSINIALY